MVGTGVPGGSLRWSGYLVPLFVECLTRGEWFQFCVDLNETRQTKIFTHNVNIDRVTFEATSTGRIVIRNRRLTLLVNSTIVRVRVNKTERWDRGRGLGL